MIGDVKADNPLILAPMAGVTDLPFRVLSKEHGSGINYMEMVSAKAITYKNKNTFALLDIAEGEGPVALQLFGSEPQIISEAIKMIDDRPYDILDINMGCPVPKVVNNGEGSALMKNPKLVYDIVSAMVKASSKPVTAKIRKGFDEENVNAVEIARIIESAGAKAVAVHGRTREQFYSGKADWEIIRQVKEAVSIPVIGNGDANSPKAVQKMFEETGCDGVMIARAARGNPWIFEQTLHYLETGEEKPLPDREAVVDLILRHVRMQVAQKGEFLGIREMRKHIAWYTTGFPNSAKLRNNVNHVNTLSELTELLLTLNR